MRKILLLLTLTSAFLFSAEFKFQQGWNLMGINANLTLNELQNQIGVNNLLVIQGPQKVYKKAYVDANLSDQNDFTALDENKGYWVKVANSVTLTYSPITNHQNTHNISLKSGWNLIAIPQSLSLEEVIEKLGRDNLLVIQGENRTYQRSYVDQGFNSANDFTAFDTTQGYWIKVAQDSTLELLFNVDKVAIDNRNQRVEANITLENVPYTLKVFSNTVPSSETSSSTLALVGKINGTDIGAILKLNSLYSLNTGFLIKVYNSDNEEIAQSKQIKYTTSPIDFGNITFNTSVANNDNTSNDSTFAGMRIFAQPLTFTEYGLESISDTDFNALTPENRRIVANKLLSLLYYGLPKTELDALINSGTFISTIQTRLNTPNTDLVSTEAIIDAKSYNWNNSNENRERILARLFNLSLGKHYMRRWTAYVLTQTILFSPANELATVRASEILNVYNRLVLLMDQDYSMPMITYTHMIDNDNWKRFRSPEDNGREMLEIFLLNFNDADVPKAGIALQNWRLDREDNELIIGLNQNDQPQELFGTTVSTGYEFYQELVKTPDFTTGVVTRIVNMYFSDVTTAKKQEVIQSIVSSNPTRFEDILLQIIFSKEFLFNTTRVKTIEEASFGLAKRMSFYDGKNFFSYMRESMDNMHQSPLNYKLGRKDFIPTDTLSFAYYYDFMRVRIMTDRRYDQLNEWDSGWQQGFISKEISGTDTINGFIDYLFLSVVERLPSSEERSMLANYAINDARSKYDDISVYNDRASISIIVMEYLSRLTELYTFKTIQE